MKSARCYRFRLDPTPTQADTFVHFAGCRRYVWNWALTRKREAYQATSKGLGYNVLAAELTLLKKVATFLKDCHSQVLQ